MDERQREIKRGMKLAADRPEVMPDEADAQIKPVYDDIQKTLRVPFVNLIFRTLANDPDYLEQAWKTLRPAFRTRAFEGAADGLRAAVLIEPVPDASPTDWREIEDLEHLRAFNDTIHYVLPKLLLVAVAFDQATFGQPTGRWDGEHNQTEIPLGVAEGTAKVQMVDPAEATGRVAAVFEAVKQRHGHPLVSSYYRALGNWPGFLETVWNRIEPRVGSAAYEERKNSLVARAEKAVRDLPISALDEPALDSEQQDEVRAVLAAFRLKFIPEMLLDVAWIKAMLDGAEAARSSPFSVAERDSARD